jgi:hypothetical protein
MISPKRSAAKYVQVVTPADCTDEGARALVHRLNQEKGDVELVGEPDQDINLPGLNLQGSLRLSGGPRLVFLTDDQPKVAGSLANPNGEIKTYGNLKVGGDCEARLLHAMAPSLVEIGGDCRTSRLWATHAQVGGSLFAEKELLAVALEVGKDVVVGGPHGIVAKRLTAGGDVLSGGRIQGDHIESRNGRVLAKDDIEVERDLMAAKGIVSSEGKISAGNIIDAGQSPVFAAGRIGAGGIIKCGSVGAGMDPDASKNRRETTISCSRLDGRVEQGYLHQTDIQPPKASEIARAQLSALQMEAFAKLESKMKQS